MTKNLDKINRVKREKIKIGMDYIVQSDRDGIVKKVSVFGSSVREDCSEDSDIDLCIYTEVPTSDRRLFTIHGTLPIVMRDRCDIFVDSSIPSGAFRDEIRKTEVVVYEN